MTGKDEKALELARKVDRRIMEDPMPMPSSRRVSIIQQAITQGMNWAESAASPHPTVAEGVEAWAYEFHDFGDVWKRAVILNNPDGSANPPTKHHGSPVRNVIPLYAARKAPAVEPGEGDWQPIETAPKDGTPFVATNGKYAYRTSWGRLYVKWPHQEGGPTYREVWNREDASSIEPWLPTLWQPLPEAPR